MPGLTSEQVQRQSRRLQRLAARHNQLQDSIRKRQSLRQVTGWEKRRAAEVRSEMLTLHRELEPAYQDLAARQTRIEKAIEEAYFSKGSDPTVLARAKKAIEELDSISAALAAAADGRGALQHLDTGFGNEWDAIIEEANTDTVLSDGGKRVDLQLARLQTAIAYADKLRNKYFRLTEHGERLVRKAERDVERRARRAARHNRRSKEREAIERDKEEARAEGRSIQALGRRLGLSDAEGVGLAMLAYIQTLQPKDRERFLATPNVIGITDAAVQRFEEMQRERERREEGYLREFREQAAAYIAQGRDDWLGTQLARCFPPSRDTVARMSRSRAPLTVNPLMVHVPFRRDEILDAVRSVYHANTREGHCADGVTPTQAFIALHIGNLAKGTPNAGGWVRIAPEEWNPSRRVVFHLLTRLRKLTGDMRPMTGPKADSVVPLDLEAFRNHIGGATLTAVRRAPGRISSSDTGRETSGRSRVTQARGMQSSKDPGTASRMTPNVTRSAAQTRAAPVARTGHQVSSPPPGISPRRRVILRTKTAGDGVFDPRAKFQVRRGL